MIARPDPPRRGRLRRRVLRMLVRRLVFGPIAPPRQIVAWWRARDRATLAEGFDSGFYLRQLGPMAAREAARAPALHYLLIGAADGLSPDPRCDLRATIDAHPARPRRRAWLDGDRIDGVPMAKDARPGVLLIDHARGGGSSHWLRLHAEAIVRNGERTVLARRAGAGAPLYIIDRADGPAVFALDVAAKPLLDAVGIARIMVNHLIDLPDQTVRGLPALAAALERPYEIALHDYHAACPRVNLIDHTGRYCGLADAAVCRECLAGTGIDIDRWRADSAVALGGATRIVAPGVDLPDRIGRVFPGVAITVAEPEPDPSANLSANPARRDTLTIVVIGALNIPKGYRVVQALGAAIVRRRARVTLTLIGASGDDRALRRAGVTVTGRYREDELDARLDALAPDILFFPAIWPETWSFTLSHALRRDVRIAAFDIGAIATRLRRTGRGNILPYALHADADMLLDALMVIGRA